MRTTRVACLAVFASILLAGCVAPEGEPAPPVDPEPEPQWVTRVYEETFTGNVPIGQPLQMDPTGACEPAVGAEPDVTYTEVPFEVTHAPSDATLVLRWESESVAGQWFFPDLELRLLGPDGDHLDACEGVTAQEEEVLTLTLSSTGTHKAIVMNYAGVSVDFELDVVLSYEELVVAEPATEEPAAPDA